MIFNGFLKLPKLLKVLGINNKKYRMILFIFFIKIIIIKLIVVLFTYILLIPLKIPIIHKNAPKITHKFHIFL